jgi:hypothetical protein
MEGFEPEILLAQDVWDNYVVFFQHTTNTSLEILEIAIISKIHTHGGHIMGNSSTAQ